MEYSNIINIVEEEDNGAAAAVAYPSSLASDDSSTAVAAEVPKPLNAETTITRAVLIDLYRDVCHNGYLDSMDILLNYRYPENESSFMVLPEPAESYYPVAHLKRFHQADGHLVWRNMQERSYISVYEWSHRHGHNLLNIQNPCTGDTIFHIDVNAACIFSSVKSTKELIELAAIKNFKGISAIDKFGRAPFGDGDVVYNSSYDYEEDDDDDDLNDEGILENDESVDSDSDSDDDDNDDNDMDVSNDVDLVAIVDDDYGPTDEDIAESLSDDDI